MSKRLLRFLLVEDEDVHAELVIRGLKKARVRNEVYRVTNGAEALAFLRQEAPYADEGRPDVILLDLKLPKVDGHELLEVVKEDEDLRMIPVVVMTTSAAETDRAKAYKHHANSYVVKPVDFGKFRQLVTDLSLYWGVWNEPPFEDRES